MHTAEGKIGIIFLIYVPKSSFIKQFGENYCAITLVISSLVCPIP